MKETVHHAEVHRKPPVKRIHDILQTVTKFDCASPDNLIFQTGGIKDDRPEVVGATGVSPNSFTTKDPDSFFHHIDEQPSPNTHEVNEQFGQGRGLTHKVRSISINKRKFELPAPEPPKRYTNDAD